MTHGDLRHHKALLRKPEDIVGLYESRLGVLFLAKTRNRKEKAPSCCPVLSSVVPGAHGYPIKQATSVK